MTGALIVGLGSPHGDDQAGWLVVEQLQARGVSAAQARKALHPADVWDWADAATHLILCDAEAGPFPPGTRRRREWPADELPAARPTSTHATALHEVLALGRTLGCCPARVEIWTIAGGSFEPATAPSLAVVAAADILAAELCARRLQV